MDFLYLIGEIVQASRNIYVHFDFCSHLKNNNLKKMSQMVIKSSQIFFLYLERIENLPHLHHQFRVGAGHNPSLRCARPT